MRTWRSIAMLLGLACLAGEAQAQNTISNLPRKETLIVENPEGTIKNAGWFNIWSINAGGQSTGLHQLGIEIWGGIHGVIVHGCNLYSDSVGVWRVIARSLRQRGLFHMTVCQTLAFLHVGIPVVPLACRR